MPRRNTFVRNRRVPNRSWTGIANATFTNVPAASKVLLGSFSLSNPNIDETLLRTIGLLAVKTDQAAQTEQQQGAFGIIVVSDAAIAVGITAIPGPVTDIEDDGWVVYVPIQQNFLLVTGAGFDTAGSVQYHFDMKGKRKTQEGERLALVVENAQATHAFDIALGLRILSMVRGIG